MRGGLSLWARVKPQRPRSLLPRPPPGAPPTPPANERQSSVGASLPPSAAPGSPPERGPGDGGGRVLGRQGLPAYAGLFCILAPDFLLGGAGSGPCR